MTTVRTFDDCQPGDRVLTTGRTITETDIVMFSAISGDWQGLHTDVEAAREGPFGERIAQGMLTLTVGLNLLFRHGGFGNGLLPSGPMFVTRLDNVRFLRPVKIGDTVRLECDISEKGTLDDRQTITLRFRVLNQGGKATVMGRLVLALEGAAPAEKVAADG
jgi:3-hydroxybutyryl-CoA dehydratase